MLSVLILGGLIVAMWATFVEMRAALRPPACPECAHCRLLAHEARLREERELARLDERIWDIQHHLDDEDRTRRR